MLTRQRALASGGFSLVDVELLPTHGGSIRLWARPAEVVGNPARPCATCWPPKKEPLAYTVDRNP